MNNLGPLKSELSKLRKRKQLSLDGTVAGLTVSRYKRGLSGYGDISRLVRHSVRHDNESSIYDPTDAAYESMDPAYEEYDPYPVAHINPRTPPLRFDNTPDQGDEDSEITYEQSVAMSSMIHKLDQERMEQGLPPLSESMVPDDSAQNHEQALPENVIDPVASHPEFQFNAEVMNHPQYDANQMTDELFEHAMQQAIEAQSLPDPQPHNPYEEMMTMYDQQMAQFMDPHMMPGHGGMPGPG